MRISSKKGEMELFYTLQGEGRSSGTTAIFLRLAMCNLHCFWCDTPYTWRWNTLSNLERFPHRRKKTYDLYKETVEMEVKDVVDKIEYMGKRYGCKRLVITGGEPMLQQTSVQELIGMLTEHWFTIEVETNGTVLVKEPMVGVQFNCSPKLSTSGNAENIRYKKEVLVDLEQRGADFKFVITCEEDLTEVDKIVEEVGIPKKRVFLMPEGTARSMILRSEKKVAEYCKEKGYRLSTRLHVLIFGGAKRGV